MPTEVKCPLCGEVPRSLHVPYVEHVPEGARFYHKTPLSVSGCRPCLERLGLPLKIRVERP